MRRSAAAWAIAWFAASAVLLVAPVYTTFGNHIEPRVLGLPWSLVWVLLVIAINCGVLAWLYAARLVDHEEPTP